MAPIITVSGSDQGSESVRELYMKSLESRRCWSVSKYVNKAALDTALERHILCKDSPIEYSFNNHGCDLVDLVRIREN